MLKPPDPQTIAYDPVASTAFGPIDLSGPVPTVRRAAVAVTMGELDPTGLTGILADARTFAAQGVRAAAVPTFVGGVPQHVDEIWRQWEAIRAALPVDAVKLGRLGGESAVRAAAEHLAFAAHPRVVCDASLLDANGEPRVSDRVVDAWTSHLLPSVLVVVVNLIEAHRLFGRPCHDRRGMLEVAHRLYDLGPKWILVEGGRLEGHPVDVLYDGTGLVELGADRVPGLRLPHTGGTLTAALVAELARGATVPAAATTARAAVNPALLRPARLAFHGAAVEPMAEIYRASGVDPAPVSVPLPVAPLIE